MFKDNCINRQEAMHYITSSFPEGITIMWCREKEGYIKKCPKKCKYYDFMPEEKVSQ